MTATGRVGVARRSRPGRLRRWPALTAGVALVSGVFAAGAQVQGPAGGTHTRITAERVASTGSTVVPELRWLPCNDGFECADAEVPLDHSRPGGRKVSLSVIKLPAADPARRIGTLFVNLGGPAENVEFFAESARTSFSRQILDRFDLVNFDPRFFGGSRPSANCVSTERSNEIFAGTEAFPVDAAQARALARANAAYASDCARNAPDLAHAATANTARDLELLRRAVGDRKLSFVGYSWGSLVGQMYAALYPDRVRAISLDGVIDAVAWTTGRPGESRRVPMTARDGSGLGAYRAFEEFTRRCDAAGPQLCAFTRDGDARAKFDQLADRLRSGPLVVDGEEVFDYQYVVGQTFAGLFEPANWGELGSELQVFHDQVFAGASAGGERSGTDAPKAGAPDPLAQEASGPAAARVEDPTEPPGDGDGSGDGSEAGDGQAPYYGVLCSGAVNPAATRSWIQASTEQDRVAPYFGRLQTWDSGVCARWQLPGVGRYLGPFDRRTSAPVLVVGNTFDPITPYTAARSTAARIPGARLLTVDGFGHTSKAVPSACADATTEAYLLRGTLPRAGAVCRQDDTPFSTGDQDPGGGVRSAPGR